MRERPKRGKSKSRITYEDVARIRGVSVGTVKQAAYTKQFDPSSLESRMRFALRLPQQKVEEEPPKKLQSVATKTTKAPPPEEDDVLRKIFKIDDDE
jgi:hypothetical protein